MVKKNNEETVQEDYTVDGSSVMDKIKELVNEGNIRSITIKDKNKKVIAKFPLTFGVLGIAIAPVLAAIGAIVALTKDCTISVERKK